MRKVIFLLSSLLILSSSFAITPSEPSPRLKASDIFIPIGKNGVKISYADLAEISARDLQKLTGKKMNFAERISFRAAQNKLRNSINNDGTINAKKIQKLAKRDGSEGFHLGGFALGFFLGLIGVLIAYLINDDYKSNRVKWAWIGVAVILVLDIILIAAVL